MNNTEIPFIQIYPNFTSSTSTRDTQEEVVQETGIDPTTMSRNYRLNQINDWRKFLESEVETRTSAASKYKRGLKVTKGLEVTGGMVSVGLTATTAVLASVVSFGALAPIIPAVIGGTTTFVAVTSKMIETRLLSKKTKHEKIAVLASSKLNSIQELVSKAIEDDRISHEEFKQVIDELEKYKTLKKEIQTARAKTTNDSKEDLEKAFERGKLEERESTAKKLSNLISQ